MTSLHPHFPALTPFQPYSPPCSSWDAPLMTWPQSLYTCCFLPRMLSPTLWPHSSFPHSFQVSAQRLPYLWVLPEHPAHNKKSLPSPSTLICSAEHSSPSATVYTYLIICIFQQNTSSMKAGDVSITLTGVSMVASVWYIVKAESVCGGWKNKRI